MNAKVWDQIWDTFARLIPTGVKALTNWGVRENNSKIAHSGVVINGSRVN